MAITVTVHDFEHARPTMGVDISGRVVATTNVIVEGLSLEADARVRMANALTAVPNYLRIGASFPGSKFPAFVVNHKLTFLDQDKALIVVEYGVPDVETITPQVDATPVLSIVSNLQTVRTAFDVNGDQIVLNRATTPIRGSGVAQPGEVDVDAPLHSITLTQIISEDPGPISLAFNGHINSVETANGDPPHSWLCEVDAQTAPDGVNWQIDYRFTRKIETLFADKVNGLGTDINVGWDSIVVMTDDNGDPVADPVFISNDVGNEGQIIVRQVLPEADFEQIPNGVWENQGT